MAELGADLDKKTDLLLDQIAGMKSPTSSMGTVSKISTAEESRRSVGGVPSPTDFPEREEDYNWRTSKINISGNSKIINALYVILRFNESTITNLVAEDT